MLHATQTLEFDWLVPFFSCKSDREGERLRYSIIHAIQHMELAKGTNVSVTTRGIVIVSITTHALPSPINQATQCPLTKDEDPVNEHDG